MRLRLGMRSKDKKTLFTEAEQSESNAGPLDKGSKDEAFFDSQTWLDSDSEDDFVSVSGDFVPSRGSTPNYQINTNIIFQLENISSANSYPESKPEDTPTDAKRRLSELLQESHDEIKQAHASGNPKVNAKSTIYKVKTSSPCGNDDNPDKDVDLHKEKTIKTKQCCLPSLPRSISFRERKNRRA